MFDEILRWIRGLDRKDPWDEWFEEFEKDDDIQSDK